MAHEVPWVEEVDGNDAPWSEVNYQKNRKSKGNGVEMTFLVQNLPERTSKMQLWRAFQPFGFVSDAYVARKKDKRGNNFGFVRYKGVGNVGATLAEMKTVKIFEAKVTIILAKYDKNHKEFIYTSKTIGEKVWRPKDPGQRNQQRSGMAVPGGAEVKEGQSYASLFQKEGQIINLGSKTLSVVCKGSKYPLHCMRRSIHGVAKDLPTLNRLHHILVENGVVNYGLSYIGGLSILITLGNPELVDEVMNKHSDLLSNTFTRFHVWNGEDLPLDRVATLRISGVPVLLRDNSLFDRIGSLFGRVIQASDFSWNDSNNSDSSVQVLVPPGKRIEESVVMQWKNRRFVVWVSEATEVWDPELDDESRSVSSDGEACNIMDENTGMDDVEEGEFRPVQNEVNDRNSMRDGDPPVEVGDQSPGCFQMDDMQQLHGNVEEPVHSPRADVDSDVGLENHYDKCSGGMETLDIPMTNRPGVMCCLGN
ncbi:putative RNA recognition motif domain, nucleotide-binding alpha-beta plait domain superfamily [Helianthus annuus]|nr:putative RNA recognition motif domain, nucleotide-binding alpha-beta plait domain superfamily [Helianthus annuus]KAJ0647544.1 putative RNA recognition motif domain, nucleotide-binding alpha-beta plait domain superfamily [Helianthus annuus]